VEQGVAHTGSVVTISVEVAVRWADLDGAVEVGPASRAHAGVVNALTPGQAIIGARRH